MSPQCSDLHVSLSGKRCLGSCVRKGIWFQSWPIQIKHELIVPFNLLFTKASLEMASVERGSGTGRIGWDVPSYTRTNDKSRMDSSNWKFDESNLEIWILHNTREGRREAQQWVTTANCEVRWRRCHCWGCMSASGVGDRVKIDRIMNKGIRFLIYHETHCHCRKTYMLIKKWSTVRGLAFREPGPQHYWNSVGTSRHTTAKCKEMRNETLA